MIELNIIKGVNALKGISINLNEILNYIENNKSSESLLSYVDEIQKGCSLLTDIFEKAFTDMIEEKQRMEDDGK